MSTLPPNLLLKSGPALRVGADTEISADAVVIGPDLVKQIIEDLTGLTVTLPGAPQRRKTALLKPIPGLHSNSPVGFNVERLEMFPRKGRTVFEAEGMLTGGDVHGTRFAVQVEMERDVLRKSSERRESRHRPILNLDDVRGTPSQQTIHFVLEDGQQEPRHAGSGTMALSRN